MFVLDPKGLFYNSVVVDLGTTGLDPSNSQIVQICAIKPTPEGMTLFNQHAYVEENPAFHINRIDPDELKDRPPEGEVLRAFWAFVQDREFIVSYNAWFERKFLEKRSKKHQLVHEGHSYICLMETFSYFFSTDRVSLPLAVRECLGFSPLRWHNAKLGAYLAFRLFSFFCFLDHPVKVEPLCCFIDHNIQYKPLWAHTFFLIKTVRLKEKIA
jgi:DNA polymerase III epsilon subunit-like protein